MSILTKIFQPKIQHILRLQLLDKIAKIVVPEKSVPWHSKKVFSMSKKLTKNLKKSLRSKEFFFNRELSWLEFNDRVLREGCNETIPLLERLKYLAIVSSNLDEFFMVRVAGLMQQRTAQIDTPDPAGMSPATQLAKISLRAHRLAAEQTVAVQEVLTQLAVEGLVVLSPKCWTKGQKAELARLFDEAIAPVATPIAMDELPDVPLLSNLRIYVGLLLEKKNDDGERFEVVAVVPVPQCLARFYPVSLHQEGMPDPCEAIVAVEDVLLANAEKLFPGQKILDRVLFRITRDGNVAINDDDVGDLCETIHTAVCARRRRAAVRLEISTDASQQLLQWLMKKLGLNEDNCYRIDGLLDASAFFEIAGRDGYERLRYETWVPQIPRDLPDDSNLWDVLRERDVLLSLPYESFDPVVRMVRRAAEDPDVLAIKQTLYRTSGDSPIVQALELAATRGKEVTVLVELKARFDEARNVVWARRLEDAGCHVLYGVAGLKTHAKALLVVRREHGRMRRYVHLATGNYNDKTAKLYSDLGLMTTDRDLTADIAAFFNLLTGYSDAVGWERITCEPVFLKQ
ncbi:MAG: polyphosphate kinase 1, partial [Thermoguttaceae bacterium]|nr:polyphosphate kinase 1 [Thermoguttaceae bacterium]